MPEPALKAPIPPEVLKQAKEAVNSPPGEKPLSDNDLWEQWRKSNVSGELPGIELQLARPDDQWWYPAFYDDKRPGISVANALPLYQGWQVALNRPESVIGITGDGVKISGTHLEAKDTTWPPEVSAHVLAKELAKHTDPAHPDMLKCLHGSCFEPGTLSTMVYYWPSEVVPHGMETRNIIISAPDKGYTTVDCKHPTKKGEITQTWLNKGSFRVEWGKDTQGSYIVASPHVLDLPQVLSIPASRGEGFSTWHEGSDDKPTAFAFYLHQDNTDNMMTRSNAYNVGIKSGDPIHFTVPMSLEVHGENHDSAKGTIYCAGIPLFKGGRDADGSLIMRPMADITADVKKFSAEIRELERREREHLPILYPEKIRPPKDGPAR